MFVEPDDLVAELSGSGGDSFAKFMCSLIKAEAATHGIPATEIDWDYRVTCPDGGCDIFIKRGHAQGGEHFIPAVPSIWSFKGGTDGTQAATLRTELMNDAHDRLRAHLRGGGAYVWCALRPASQPKRQKMYAKAQELAKELGFDLGKVEFRWVDALASTTERHPNVIARRLPSLARRLKDVCTLDQWIRESRDSQGFEVPWVNFSGRDVLKARVRDHLLSSAGPAVLHIAGISGIGKTRTAIQACRDDNELADTFYAERYASLSGDFLRRIGSPGRYVRMIIDEVSLTDYDRLSDQFRECAGRVRLVTLGPARRDERARASTASLLIMEEPRTQDGVLRVVQEAGPDLPGDVQVAIAECSGHDLRLALLLVRAAVENPEFENRPVRNLDGVWERVVNLFGSDFKNITGFPGLYEKLTAAIDVGRDGPHRSELKYLAEHFGVQPQELDRVIHAADQSGLGLRTPQFFEATPRALAVWVFADRLWGALEPTVDRFLQGMPTERLRRRFIERCQELRGPQRKEVLDRVGRFFLTSLGEPKLARLYDRESSRVFGAWVELDPERGLPWLVRAIEQASDDQIRAFDGAPDGSGGWRGRRQVVWLCENLACFGQYFGDCERALFRLAEVETEEHIGNNSRNTWKGMFLPILSNTEVPFGDRWALLMTRLRRSGQQDFALVFEAVMGVFGDIGGRLAAPSVVGGRIVPDEWRPRTRRELGDHLRTSAKELLHVLPELEGALGTRAVGGLIDHLDRFTELDIFEELRAACSVGMHDPVLVRALRAKLDYLIAGESRESGSSSRFLEPLRTWRANIEPSTLKDQLVDLTSREPWFASEISAPGDSRASERVYEEMAKRVLPDRDLLTGLEEWFSSANCRSGGALGFALGRVDESGGLLPLVLRWLAEGRALDLASSYLQAVSSRSADLPRDVVHVLDDLAGRAPALALRLSVESDRSTRGFERIMTCLARTDVGQCRMVRRMIFNGWPKVLGDEMRHRLLSALEALAVSADPSALAVAFGLLAGWTEHGKVPLPERLTSRGLSMLGLAADSALRVNDHDWKILTELLAMQFPIEVARILADAITDVEPYRYHRRGYAQETFKRLAAQHPGAAMEAIGRWVMDEKRGVIFRLWEFRALFDAIGLETVRPWVQEHGRIAAVRIARHLDGPRLDTEGRPVVPPLADWLLTEFESDDDVLLEFCLGRHSGVVRSGDVRDYQEEVEHLVKAFASDTRRWVQKWARFELDELQIEIAHELRHEDEMERS